MKSTHGSQSAFGSVVTFQVLNKPPLEVTAQASSLPS
jgi:hypothetical protein